MKLRLNPATVGALVTIFLFTLILVIIVLGIGSAGQSANDERTNALHDIIVRAAAQCYAIEGFYPPNPQYLMDNYGVIIDESKYFIEFSGFASNIMPSIVVTELGVE